MLPNVLLVEDDELIREVYATKFELEGFPLAVAENGAKALEVMESFKPDIILLDLMMPVMNGLEFVKRLHALERPMPEVIVFSNVSSPTQPEHITELGVRDYWIKSDYTPDKVASELIKRWRKHEKV